MNIKSNVVDKFQIGDTVKIIDKEEQQNEWAEFVITAVTECTYQVVPVDRQHGYTGYQAVSEDGKPLFDCRNQPVITKARLFVNAKEIVHSER